jgi:F-type H+-transporting ATPase subunit b
MMKTRKLLAALALVVLGIFSFTAVAGAQEEEGEPAVTSAETEEEHGEYADHASEECAHLLAEGGTPDDCQEAPSPILPATNELVWGGITFAVLLLGMWKWGIPAVKNMMEERTERIRADLDAAEGAKTEADRIRQEYSAQLADAKSESARIIEEARQAADAVRRDLTQRAEAEAAELRQRNAEALDAERARLLTDLQSQVASLAIELAEKVVEGNLDRDTNNRLIENYISQVGR